MGKGRLTFNFLFLRWRSPRAILPKYCLLISLPAFILYGCARLEETTTYDVSELIYSQALTGSPTALRSVRVDGAVTTLDVFVYDDDELGRLDVWQHFDNIVGGSVTFATGLGAKTAVFVANVDCCKWSVSQVQTASALAAVSLSLRSENPSHPAMTGSLALGADTFSSTVTLTPIMSRITLQSLTCDFSGHDYAGSTLDNVSVYLTNVSASAPLLQVENFIATDYINSAHLSEVDLEEMACPSMLYADIGESIGPRGLGRSLDFYCYPNEIVEEGLGTSFTRLVVQGDIGGQTYYYPVNINQPGFGYSSGTHGISRNVHYSISLSITRKGSLDPDTPVDCSDIEESGWIELHPGQLIGAHAGEDVHVWCDLYPEDTPLDICLEDLEFDRERGIYDYTIDPDGHGVTLHCRKGGTGMFTIDAGHPVNDGFLVIIVVDS